MTLRGGHAITGRAGSAGRDALGVAVLALVAAAWALLVVAQVTGSTSLVHAHGAPVAVLPPLVALASFLVSWQLMVVATMLPASLPSIRVAGAVSRRRLGAGHGGVVFLAGFAAVWTAVGLFAFVGGQVVGGVVGPNAWLATRPWLLQAAVVAVAGAYQLTALKRRSLAACRHPARLPAHAQAPGTAVLRGRPPPRPRLPRQRLGPHGRDGRGRASASCGGWPPLPA